MVFDYGLKIKCFSSYFKIKLQTKIDEFEIIPYYVYFNITYNIKYFNSF